MSLNLIKHENPYLYFEYIDPRTLNSLRVAPERGGLITQWCCGGRDVFYFDLERFLQTDQSIRGGIPILFPICGALKGDLLYLDSGKFYLPQHGFARDRPWHIDLLEDKQGVRLSLDDDEITRACYPYCFLIQIELRLDRNVLDIQVLIENHSQEKMPCSFGLHPYFKVNDLKKIKVEGLPPKCFDYLTDSESNTFQQLDLLNKGVDFLTGPAREITLFDLPAGTRIDMQFLEPMDLVVVWTDPPRSMVCIEPWTSPRNALISGERQLMLDPGDAQKLSCKFLAS